MPDTRPCDHCGAPVTRLPSRFKPGAPVYCNCTCMAAARKATPLADRAVETRPCDHCAAPVIRNRSYFTPGKSVYCNRACMAAARTKPAVARPCDHCGVVFTPKFRANTDAAKYCSVECSQLAGSIDWRCAGCGEMFRVARSAIKRSTTGNAYCPSCTQPRAGKKIKMGRPGVELVTVACAGCGKELHKYPSAVAKKRTDKFFCSLECRRGVSAKPITRPVIACEQCGKPFRAHTKKSRFCSKGCHDAQQGSGRVTRNCPGCGKEFSTPRSQAHILTCSTACYNTLRVPPIGTRRINSDGYVQIYQPGAPGSHATGWILEHRWIVGNLLGRALLPHENVHHLNTNRSDNSTDGPLRWVDGKLRSGNLELWTHSQPSGGRVGEVAFDAALYPGAPPPGVTAPAG